MKIAAFLKLRNESENGHLIRCLENCKKWSNEIFIYDDFSTDDSKEIYLNYTYRENIIFGEKNDFSNELFQKQKLLDLINSKYIPDWIGWNDGDAIYDYLLTNEMEKIIEKLEMDNYDSLLIHYFNLWRSEVYYRTDNKFNGLDVKCLWKNKNLSYNTEKGLHKLQHPNGLERTCTTLSLSNIHYGFYSEIDIVRKYLTYKGFGQKRWALDRFFDESKLSLIKLPKSKYPTENIPDNYDNELEPTKISYDKYIKYNNWEDYKKQHENMCNRNDL